MSDNDAAGAATPNGAQENRTGLRLIISGAVILFLAPLAGFLGGTMVGSSGSAAGLDPLFLWLFPGMVAGGIGGAIALLGVLRWMRTHRNQP